MLEVLSAVSLLILLAVLVLQLLSLRGRSAVELGPILSALDALRSAQERTDRGLRDELARSRDEASGSARNLREELASSLKSATDSLINAVAQLSQAQRAQLDGFASSLSQMTQANQAAFRSLREEVAVSLKASSDSAIAQTSAMAAVQKDELATLRAVVDERLELVRASAALSSRQTREETGAALKAFNDSVIKSMGEMAAAQKSQLEAFGARLGELTASNEARLELLRASVESKLGQIQVENAARLEEMRRTVDEKLQGTLEKRLGESFKLVSDRLEQVHKGLGEMQSLANGVGDLKKVLANVKARGTWGEMQLGNLLEQMLTPEQFERNVATRKGSAERVEFAVKLPGRDEQDGTVWLPIDAKFPREDYERLVDAAERADAAGVEQAGRDLELRLKAEARDIHDKYLDPPNTTDFAILFLPVEGLWAEALRRPGLVDALQRECRVTIAGPTTLAALLNSLQMGFRTLAIQRRSSEVWAVLGAVKTEFGKFGDVIGKVQKKLQEASNVIDTAAVRTRAIERKLRDVQELSAPAAAALLDAADAVVDETGTS